MTPSLLLLALLCLAAAMPLVAFLVAHGLPGDVAARACARWAQALRLRALLRELARSGETPATVRREIALLDAELATPLPSAFKAAELRRRAALEEHRARLAQALERMSSTERPHDLRPAA